MSPARPADGTFEGRALACVRGDRPVFAGLDFALPPGGALVLSGPNGSGKSSLLRVMAGLLPPAAGVLAWAGAPVTQDPEGHRGRLHYVGHLDALKPALSVEENLSFWAGLRTAAPRVEAALARLGLDHLADLPARLLSAGQRRRLALSRLLAAPAELWLLDEPSVGLDARSIASLTDIIAEHRAAGGRVAVATHLALSLPEARPLSLDDFPAAVPSPEAAW